MTAGFCCWRKSSAAWPSLTTPMTRMRGSASRRWTRSIRATLESSATSTLILASSIGINTRSDQATDGFEKVALIEAAFDEVGVRADVDAALAILASFQGGDQDDREFG